MPYKATEHRKMCQSRLILDPLYQHLQSLVYMMKAGYPSLQYEGREQKLHTLIMKKEHGLLLRDEIDHINRNTLDNRLCNLRFCTKSANLRNREKPPIPYLNTTSNKFYAQVRNGTKRISLGHFTSQVKAARIVQQYYKFLQDMEDLKIFRLLRKSNVAIPVNSYYYNLQSPIMVQERQG
jgi:hypothetical protein